MKKSIISIFHSAIYVTLMVASTCSQAGNYWNDVGRNLPVSPLGNKIAISCHNCYGENTIATQGRVEKALNRKFDLIEFDLTLHSDGQVYIEHEDSEKGVGSLVASLSDNRLQQSDAMLFFEIKEKYSTIEASDAMMLGILRALRDWGYAKPGRPIFLRAFMDTRYQHLVRAKELLNLPEFAQIRSNVRFHALIESDARNHIRLAKSLGFDGVEFEYRRTNLYGTLMQAKLLGLGVGVYTTPASMGELFLSALREDLDFITTEYDNGASANTNSARSLIEESTSLLYMNTAEQSAWPLSYKRTAPSRYFVPQANSSPSLEVLPIEADEDRVGGSMVFSGKQSVTTWQADNDINGGYLVSAVVNFDDLASGESASIIAKSDSGGFALEQVGNMLRFGVFVNGAYQYATMALSKLSGSDSYFVVGAYDGKGAVRIWINNIEGSPSNSVSGGVVWNTSPIVIGADPQGATARRYYFKGKIQQVMVQRWRDH